MKRLNSLLADSEIMIVFTIIVVVTIIVATIMNRFLKKQLNRRMQEHEIDITGFLFLKHVVVAIIYLIGFGWAFLSLPFSKTFAHSLLAGAGASTLILGFASQHVLSNMVSGVFIIIYRPFKINDHIDIDGHVGVVREINLHETIIENDTKVRIIIPNSLISNGVVKNLGT